MYKALEKFNNIIVSGPQRSGTRIAAKIIAYDTGKPYVDETEINSHDFIELKKRLKRGNAVTQCPALCNMLHLITDLSTLIIVMRRSVDQIMASEKRIGWDKWFMYQELHKYGRTDGVISKIKYDFWETIQKPILKDRAREIIYSDLKNHPLFIEKNKRAKFKWNQTE